METSPAFDLYPLNGLKGARLSPIVAADVAPQNPRDRRMRIEAALPDHDRRCQILFQRAQVAAKMSSECGAKPCRRRAAELSLAISRRAAHRSSHLRLTYYLTVIFAIEQHDTGILTCARRRNFRRH